MLARIPLRLFLEWMAYYSIEPFGPQREAIHAALMPWFYALVHQEKGKPKPKLEDFILDFGSEDRVQTKQTPEQMEMIFRQFALAHNAANAAKRKRGIK